MAKDMTYEEIAAIKANISAFVDKIKQISESYNFDISQCDANFFSFISKHIVFFKYIYDGSDNLYFVKVLISDFYYLVLSIVKSEERYMYVNLRSIIENYTRAIMQVTVQDNHVTQSVFEQLSQTNFRCNFTAPEYSLIKSEYVTACGYVHGGDILCNSLASVLSECEHFPTPKKKRNEYYAQWSKMIKVFDRLLIAQYPDFINGRFHRRKSVMGYLIGDDQVDLLFRLIK